MMGIKFRVVGGLCGMIALAAGATARAQSSCSVTGLSSTQLAGDGLAATPVSDVQFIADANESLTYLARNNTIYAVYNKTTPLHAAGTLKAGFVPPTFPSPMAGGQPQLVELGATSQRALITAAGGMVFRVDAGNGGVLWTYDARRSSCLTDQVQAIPVVVLKSEFPSLPDDLVIVSTRYTCSPNERTTNRLIALGANPAGSTPIVYWTSSSSLPLDQGVGGTLDYVNGFLYYTFRQPYAQQPSLVRFNFANGSHMNGTTSWSIAAGDVTSIPQLRDGNRVFVATLDATIRAFDLGTRVRTLNYPVANFGSTTLTQSFVMARGGDFDGMLVATTQDGFVRALVVAPQQGAMDNAASVPWPAFKPGGIAASAPVAFATKVGKLFVPRVDGKVTQANATSGAIEATAIVGTGSLAQPALDVEGNAASVNRLLTASAYGTGSSAGTRMTQLCIPWNVPGGQSARAGDPGEASPLGPPADEDAMPCKRVSDCPVEVFGGDGGAGEWRMRSCQDGVCISSPVNVGQSCVKECVGTGVSLAGDCVLTTLDGTAGGCVCDSKQPIGGFGCVAGSTCLGVDGCHNLLTDNAHCGAAGKACDSVGYEKCVNGRCVKYACDVYTSADQMAQLVTQGKMTKGTSATIAWRKGSEPDGSNSCEYVLGLGSQSGEGGIGVIRPNGTYQTWIDSAHINPITSVAVEPTAPDGIFGTFAELSQPGSQGGLAYTSGLSLKYIDSPATNTGSSLPFIYPQLDSGPMGVAMQSKTANSKFVYVGNMTKIGDVHRAVATYSNGTYTLGTLSNIVSTPNGYRVVGLSYAPRIKNVIDGRLWVAFASSASSLSLGAYCDATINDGFACQNPGFVTVQLPNNLSKIQPGIAVLQTGDYLLVASDSDGLFKAYLVAGQDFKVHDANKVNESIGLPTIPPRIEPFMLTTLGGIGIVMSMPGTSTWGTTEMYKPFSTR